MILVGNNTVAQTDFGCFEGHYPEIPKFGATRFFLFINFAHPSKVNYGGKKLAIATFPVL